MKNNHTTLLTVANFILLLLFISLFIFFNSNSESEIVYVDNIEIFNGFNMTADLDKMNKKKLSNQKMKIDSLYRVYEVFRQEDEKLKLKELESELRSADINLRRMSESMSNELREKVWQRINSYIEDYGKINKYKIILGTQGNGTIMYAIEGKDITTEFLEYANSKYEGN